MHERGKRLGSASQSTSARPVPFERDGKCGRHALQQATWANLSVENNRSRFMVWLGRIISCLRVPAKLLAEQRQRAVCLSRSRRERIPLVNPADTRSTRREKKNTYKFHTARCRARTCAVHNERQQTNSAATHPIAQEEPLLPFP